MQDPFPIPKTFVCPYCGTVASRSNFDADRNLAYFSHKLHERKKVGQVIWATLHILHYFSVAWKDHSWQVTNASLGSSKVCEQAELGNGYHTDWCSCDEAIAKGKTK